MSCVVVVVGAAAAVVVAAAAVVVVLVVLVVLVVVCAYVVVVITCAATVVTAAITADCEPPLPAHTGRGCVEREERRVPPGSHCAHHLERMGHARAGPEQPLPAVAGPAATPAEALAEATAEAQGRAAEGAPAVWRRRPTSEGRRRAPAPRRLVPLRRFRLRCFRLRRFRRRAPGAAARRERR